MGEKNIVSWLRSTAGLSATHPALGGYTSRHGEAADEIERLRDEVSEKDAKIAEVIDKNLLLFSKHERLKKRIRRALEWEEEENA